MPPSRRPRLPMLRFRARAAPAASVSREDAIKVSPRVAIETPSLRGSIALRGGRFDDLVLVKYHLTVDPKSPNVELFSPSDSPHPYFAEYGFVAPTGSNVKVPDRDTLWQCQGSGALTPATPVTLTWDNGQGVVFKRTISVDDDYMFKIVDERREPLAGRNRFDALRAHPPLRHAEDREQLDSARGPDRRHRRARRAAQQVRHGARRAAAHVRSGDRRLARLHRQVLGLDRHPGSDGAVSRQVLGPGAEAAERPAVLPGRLHARHHQRWRRARPASVQSQLFAGAKQMKILQAYQNSGVQQFDLLIDWGWFFFITKPLFQLMEAINSIVHNFGVTILILTVIVRLVFFPLASKQYASMAKMKKLQPQMEQMRERYKDDKVKQQQELMDLYKREKVNPVAGCVPILLQLPVFFALYKVLFITIDMRHAPFFGWIKDLSAPDPTSLFNLFGLLPYAVPEFLHVGVWPLIMGITMWLQMQLNPAAARSRAAADLQLDAGAVHVPAGVVPCRPRDLLGVEQHPVADAAVLHHEEAGRRGSPHRQHLTQVQARGFDGRARRRRHQAATRRKRRQGQADVDWPRPEGCAHERARQRLARRR